MLGDVRIAVDLDALYAHFKAADLKQDRILTALSESRDEMAKTLAEMKAELQKKLDANLKAVEANTTVDQGMITLVQGLVAQNATMKQELLDAIAAGGDPSSLQPIIDALDAQNSVLEASTAKSSAALVANTAPPVTP